MIAECGRNLRSWVPSDRSRLSGKIVKLVAKPMCTKGQDGKINSRVGDSKVVAELWWLSLCDIHGEIKFRRDDFGLRGNDW